MERADLVIVGGGAAGLMAAVHAGRAARGRSVVVLESARKPGAKILVSGGGRCNVTHDVVEAEDFSGATLQAVRTVLRRFDVERTVAFFRELGVVLKREPTGKLFPVTDSARTVLEALLRAVALSGSVLRHPVRVQRLERVDGGFRLEGDWGSMEAGQVVLATGGRSLPRSGSDGHGFTLARGLGHGLTGRIFPALVPLLLPAGHFLTGLSGLSADVMLEVRAASNRRLARVEGALLCTHFGVSGPAVLDVSRHHIDARHDDPGCRLVVCWWPGLDSDGADRALSGLGRRGAGAWLRERLPDRLARALCDQAGVDPAEPGARIPREARRRLASMVANMDLPVTGDRGFTYAEVTAGGVPLDEIRLDTMRSRKAEGLLLCGEMLAVDGPVGGYNFQWAWASGFVAGSSAFAESTFAHEAQSPRHDAY
ncbi:MAG: NAD(P)/FAD-dependent oxidoreductase [Candidatus Polarisedimenticolia bacterium]